MELAQKAALGTFRLRFQFGPDSLRYTARRGFAATSFWIRYEDIPTEGVERSAVGRTAAVIALAWTAAGAVWVQSLAAGPLRLASPWPGLLGILAGAAILWRLWPRTWIEVVSYQTRLGPVQIVKDGQRAAVEAGLRDGRKANVLARYGAVNLEAEPGQELKKFQWLKEQGYITERDFHEAVLKINTAAEQKKKQADQGGQERLQ